jgi:hypothetical protein
VNYATSTKIAAIHAVPGKALGIWAFVLSFLLPVAGLVLGIIALLQSRRVASRTTRTLRDNVATIDGPAVLVGHSYGGASSAKRQRISTPSSAWCSSRPLAPAIGESCASVQEPFSPPLLASTIRPTPHDAVGAVGGPDLTIDREQFRETFCADVPADVAQVMAASQRPLAATPCSSPARLRPRPSFSKRSKLS